MRSADLNYLINSEPIESLNSYSSRQKKLMGAAIFKSLCLSQRLLVLQRILSFFSSSSYYYYCYKYEPTITVIKAITNAHFEAQFNSAYAPFGILGINNFSKSVSKGGDFFFI